jgi:hypothetical protein
MADLREVEYFVLSAGPKPYLLARVRWPDVSDAISAGRHDWPDDPGLFDLPYDSASKRVTPEEAAEIAAGWGAQLPAEGTGRTSRPSFIRRMPAQWSDLSPAEKRAWCLEPVKTGCRALPHGAVATTRWGSWRRRRQTTSTSGQLAQPKPALPVPEAAPDLGAIDLRQMDQELAS